MKLILANNQGARFVDFYADLATRSSEGFAYSAYSSLLFSLYETPEQPVAAYNLATGQSLADYSGIYINGYLNTYELAVATALACQALDVPFVNHEMAAAPSLSKVTEYVKLAAAGLPIPRTLAGSKAALLKAPTNLVAPLFPAVLKRADADRGIDNFMVQTPDELPELLADHADRSLWILQEFVPNDGYYVLNFYHDELAFCIFRSLQERPDGDRHKAHMYKPKGGANAHLLPASDVPPLLLQTARQALQTMDRQIGSVDCLYSPTTNTMHILEVNYNPQLVTIETFKEERVQAFLDNIDKQW